MQLGDILTARLLCDCWSFRGERIHQLALLIDLVYCLLKLFSLLHTAEWACAVLNDSLTTFLTFLYTHTLVMYCDNILTYSFSEINIDVMCSSLF